MQAVGSSDRTLIFPLRDANLLDVALVSAVTGSGETPSTHPPSWPFPLSWHKVNSLGLFQLLSPLDGIRLILGPPGGHLGV